MESPTQEKYSQIAPLMKSKGVQKDACETVSVATSPLKCINEKTPKRATDAVNSILSSDSEPEASLDEDTSYKYSTSCDSEPANDIRGLRRNSTLVLIEKNQRLYLGLDSENYFIIKLLTGKTGIAYTAILILLRKIRLNDSFSVLAEDFGVSLSTATRYFTNSLMPVANN